VKLGRTIATIDVQLREEGSNTLVAQVSWVAPTWGPACLPACLPAAPACAAASTANSRPVAACFCLICPKGTHIKFIAENKPTMEQIIEQQAKEAQQQGQRQQGQQHQATLLGIRSKL
jgi:hypothetical protein